MTLRKPQRFQIRKMTAPQRKFLDMAVKLARTVRRGQDPELARAAADFEILWLNQLNEAPALELMAAEERPPYDTSPAQSGGGR